MSFAAINYNIIMKFSPEIYTEKIEECRQFYCDYLGFVVKKQLEGFIILAHAENPEYEIMFCVPNSQFVDPIFRPQFRGQGLIFQIEVADVDAEYARFKKLPVTIKLPLTQEEVNGSHFTIADPNGIFIDIVQFI